MIRQTWQNAWVLLVILAVVSVVGCSDSDMPPKYGDGDTDNFDVSPDSSVDEDGSPIEIAEIQIVPPAAPFVVGSSALLRAQILDENGDVIRQAEDVEWSVEDNSILTLDTDEGRMQAEAAGETTLSVQWEELDDSVEISVEGIEPSIDIVSEELIIALPEHTQLEIVATDENGQLVSEPSVRWESSDTSVARISAGQLRTLSEGDVTITAHWRGISDSLEVKVRRIKELQITPGSRELWAGDQIHLGVRYLSSDGTALHTEEESPVEWSTSDSIVAQIDSTGLLEANKGGSVDVTAESRGEVTQATFYVDVSYTDISCYTGHCCMLSTQKDIYCWGENNMYQLGLGDTYARNHPVRLDAPTSFEAITTSSNGGCALDTQGKPWCWGMEAFGRLGTTNPITDTIEMPSPTNTQKSFKDIILHPHGTYALDQQGRLYAWGVWPPQRAPDINTVTHYTSPTMVDSGPWSGIADVQEDSLCLYDASGVQCIGSNASLQLGQGEHAPTHFDTFIPWGQSAGIEHTVGSSETEICGLDGDGKVWCASDFNQGGILGHPVQPGGGPHHHVPTRTAWADTFDRLHRSHHFLCGERGGELWCWGPNMGCQLGWDPGSDPDVIHSSHSSTPVFMDLPSFSAIGLAGLKGCIVEEKGGVLQCWGLNQDPQRPRLTDWVTGNCNPELVQVHAYERP